MKIASIPSLQTFLKASGFEDCEVTTGQLKAIELEDISEGGGVYFMTATQDFIYPTGESSVFYIGQSKNLRKRLATHKTFVEEASSQDEKMRRHWLYHRRYEYAAVFGESYFVLKNQRGYQPKTLEDKILAYFAREYRATPVANGQASWKRISDILGSE